MRFLADESRDFAAVRALRGAGHDVLAVAELAPRTDDEGVMELASREGRILLTEDKDFGRLVHARRATAGGVLLLRFPAKTRPTLAASVCELVERWGSELQGRFAVVQPGRARILREP